MGHFRHTNKHINNFLITLNASNLTHTLNMCNYQYTAIYHIIKFNNIRRHIATSKMRLVFFNNIYSYIINNHLFAFTIVANV